MALVGESSWKNWEKTGRQEFMKAFQALLPPEKTSLDDYSEINLVKKAAHELIWKYLRGHLRREHTLQAFGEMTTFHSEMGSVLIDILTLVDIETSMLGNDKEREEVKERFLSFLKECDRYLSIETLKERMEIETLGSAQLVKNSKKFFSTVIKTKTKLFYKQQKFNLFREECEGYAKLITELNADLSQARPADSLEVIKSIIGYFNLDPNRVLDIILESFECQLDHHEFFIDLLRRFTPDGETMNELLGFKFKFYLSEEDESGGKVPESLFRQTALMIQYGVLDMEVIYDLLGPSDEEIMQSAEKELVDAKDMVRKMSIVSTSQDKKEDDSADAFHDHEAVVASNQKFGLLKALLDVGAWTEAEKLITRLPLFYAVSQPSIAKALSNLIHIKMAPVHEKHSGLGCRLRTKRYESMSESDKLARSFEDFKEMIVPMLLSLGPYAYHDSVLLYKVVRILKASLKIPTDDPGKDREKIADPVDPQVSCLYYDALTILDEVILPALSLMDGPNCSLGEEIWSVLRVYPYHMRYRLYGQWKGDTFSQHALLMKKKASVQKSIKRIMQRLSKENVKHTSRQLAKLSHSSPGLLFDYVLSQIQLYDNLIGPVVDSLRYLTNLSFDVLGYEIIEALNNPEKDRTKHDGTSISLWLQSLSNFCGAVYKKHSIDLTGILQYVANQLKIKRSLDLLILKEVVLKMSGIDAAEELTEEQIEAMAGGELLRQEAGSFNQIKNTKKSSQKLKDAVIDNNLAVPLCLLMAQQRNCVVYQETENSHLKLVGNLFDQCQDTLVQFGQFLATNLSIDDYTLRLPPMNELLTRYHVNSDLAFFLARPMFNHQISLRLDALRRDDPKAWKSKTDGEKNEIYVKAAREVMEPVITAIRPLHPARVWVDISPQFFTTFWSLTMYDLFVPDPIYEKEIAKLKMAPSKVDENKDLNASRKKKEKERIQTMMEKLIDEQKKQREHVDRVRARLEAEKDTWFLSRSSNQPTLTTFLQLFLFPRCIFTAIDAIYCAKFVQTLHMLKTPNFSTLLLFDRIFCDITYTVTSCTENEAHRLGRFLAALLSIVMKWHKSKDVFDKECIGYPGFVTKFRVATNETREDAKGSNSIDYENYRHVVHKWHFKIAKAMVVCLDSKDYVQIRNALTILTKILPHFPVIAKLNGVIEKRIEKVCNDEKESRKDLYIKAMSYSGQLKARKHCVMKEHEFHQVTGATDEKTQSGQKDDDTPKKTTSVKKEPSVSKDLNDANSRSQSREKSLSRSERENSEDRKARRERESKSRDRALKDKRREEERHERDRPRDMGPPASGNSHRRSMEPSEERELSKKRKNDTGVVAEDSSGEKRSKRDKSDAVTSPNSSNSKREKKNDRKRQDRDEGEIYEEKRKRSENHDERDSRQGKASTQNGDSDRKSRAGSTSASSNRRGDKRK